MPNAIYYPGAVTRLTVAITDTAAVAVDPGVLRLKVKSPSAVITNWTVQAGQIVKDSVGNYHADVALPDAGQWLWRWEADAPNAGATEGYLQVTPSTL